DAIEFSFDDVGAAEFVQVQAADVEDALGNQREAVEEQHFFEAPSGKLRNFLEQHHDETQREDGGGEAGCEADEKIAAINDAPFRVMREIIEEQAEMPVGGVEEAGDAGPFGNGCCRWQSLRHELASVNGDLARRAFPPHMREPTN